MAQFKKNWLIAPIIEVRSNINGKFYRTTRENLMKKYEKGLMSDEQAQVFFTENSLLKKQTKAVVAKK